LETSGCAQDCCTHTAVASVATLAAPVKPRLTAHPQFDDFELAIPTAQPVTGDSPLAAPTFSPPPRYILNQTFRI
jgi:hypothetical protein